MPYEVLLPGGFAISDDQDRLDLDEVHRFLNEESYWAAGRRRDLFERSVRNSIVFGLYDPGGGQAGFARVMSDRALLAHISDVYVLAKHRGLGLGKALVAAVLSHPDLAEVPTWTLKTLDAHGLYASFGFAPVPEPARHMVRQISDRGRKTS